ncbi:hypothetical protein V490_06528 [Pseudogymnoascus sp. VKM F-3557]|nr:hypothetical protein V490_06528 [Pseudogymnoascus sp. VKM F-3557]
MHTPPVPPLNTEAVRFLSLRPVSNGPQQCRLAIRMDVSRNVTKTVASRSANWTTSIIRTTGTTPSTFSHSAPLFNNRGISTLPSNVRRGRHNLIPSNAAYKLINTTFCRRGLQTNASTEGTSQSTQSAQEDKNPEASAGGAENTWPFPKTPQPPRVPIRERLRLWEAENASSEAPIVSFDHDHATHGQVSNLYTRPVEGDRIREIDDGQQPEDPPLPLFEGDDLVGFGSQRSFLLRGDLVELRTHDGIRIELAIFVRELGIQCQFYTMSGRWVHKASRNARFFVPNFVSPEEVDPLIAYLPDADVPEAIQDKLQSFENALPRSIGAPLLQKMADFGHAADAVYRDNLDALDNAYSSIALPQQVRHLSLPRITRELLNIPKETRDEAIAPSTLYAVYRTIMNEGMGFSVQTAGNTRSWGRFEVVPKKIVDSMKMVTRIIRSWQVHTVTSARDGESEIRPYGQFMAEFESFLGIARRAIDDSRKDRASTTSGQIGPASVNAAMAADSGGPVKATEQFFDTPDIKYIRFMKCWVAWDTFSHSSPMNGIGSAILRATGRYDGQPLDRATGWQFLQEIGIISPWETKASFELRLPGYGYYKYGLTDKQAGEEPEDALAALRKDWEELPVYCIDDTGAHEIDDGVSIEASETEGEHWVHIHVADPGSLFTPSSDQAKKAMGFMQTVYMPDRVIPMLPDSVVQEKLSLAPNRPTLTFSAKMNAKGEMVDHKITAGIIRKVIYLTPATLGELLGNKASDPVEVLAVGDSETVTSFNDGVMHRDMATVESLSASDKANLKQLASLGDARRRYALLRGGIDLNNARASIVVKIDKDVNLDHYNSPRASTRVNSDPYISVSTPPATEGPNIYGPVTNLMTLGGEIAAAWCSTRNIPIIYRVTQAHPDKPDPGAFFRDNVLPYVLRGESVPKDVQSAYVFAQGPVLPSSVPGPHVALGVEMYSKCTSPLRRFSDLLAHWQIHAALLEEAKTGKSLVGSEREDYLPFPKASVDILIPKMDGKEKALGAGRRGAERAWALQAVLRAWKFGQSKGWRDEWEFRVLGMMGGMVNGFVDGLGLMAMMDKPAGIEPDEIREGDVFTARIKKVNPYEKSLLMEPLTRVSTAGSVEQRESPGDAGQGSHIPISQQQQWRLQKNPGAQEDGARIAGAATAPAQRLKHSRSPAPGVNGKWSSVRIQREGASEMGGRMKLAGAEVVGFSAPQRGSLGGDLGLSGTG